MGRFWSLLFLMVPVLGVAIFVCGAMSDSWPLVGYWLPEDVSRHGAVIDGLFMSILYLTGVIFIVTGLALFWFLWKYDAGKNTQPVKYTHGSHTLEVIWSILPAAVLLFIAVYQINAWADARMRRPILSKGEDRIEGTKDDVLKPPFAQVTGKQFGWDIRYPGVDGVIGTADDVFDENILHVPVDEDVVLMIKSRDVLHSFFLPNLRIKQDVVPGMVQYVWFQANQTGNNYDIVCAELCGWGHYKMRGRLIIEKREQFDNWLAEKTKQQEQSDFSASVDEDE